MEERSSAACSRSHMFATYNITCLSIKQYQFTGRDIPLQKLAGWPFCKQGNQLWDSLTCSEALGISLEGHS